MELYKEQKKNRKKKGSTRSINADGSDDGKGSQNGDDPIGDTGNVNIDSETGGDIGGDNDGKENGVGEGKMVDPPSSKKKKKKKKDKTSNTKPSSITHSSASEEYDQDVSFDQEYDVTTNESNAQTSQTEHASHASTSPPLPPPPPGFQESISSFNINDRDHPYHENEHQSRFPLSQNHEDPLISNAFTNPLTQPSSQRYIIIPNHERPNPSLPSSNTSLSVAAAKAFVELYYPHITHGLSSDLATYYTPHAQKSISVGGAHHVVATPSDIMLQLSKFSGSTFLVRGVVSQDTFDNKGAHVLITGIVQTTLNDQTSFAHSVSLVKKQNPLYSFSSDDSEYSFQIHNDALSLLTLSDMISNERQSQG